jgi:hypothetical protein
MTNSAESWTNYKNLSKEEFEQPEQARYQLNSLMRKLKLCEVDEIKLTPKESKNQRLIYRHSGVVKEKSGEIAKRRKEAGRFILATNVVDQNELSAEEILRAYKN